MTEQMLLAKGFNEQQAQAILRTAAIAQAAATEVKTFTQLIGTIKEAIGTGWADTFRIVIGNFEEAKTLFTGINNAVSGFVQRMSDSRNAILQQWKDFGGRADLIQGLKDAFGALSFVVTAVKEAFQNIFPPVTAATLVRLTASFKEFALSLTPTADTLDKIKRISQGVFAALSIGWEVIKEGTKFVAGLVKQLASLFLPETSGALAKLGDGFTKLQEVLVKEGGIKAFFEGLSRIIQKPIDLIKKFKDVISDVFSGFDDKIGDKVGDSFGRLGDRFQSLQELFKAAGRLWEPFEDALRKIADVLGKIWDVISEFFGNIGDKIANSMSAGDFSKVMDVINTGLLGGIVLLFRKFIKEGLSVDLSGGLFDKVNGMLDQLTSNLKAMQMNVKASAIMKIAEAIAILTASVLVLSMIDSVALTKALAAMGVGFGELMASFSVLTKMTATPAGAATFGIIAAGLIELSTAILILSLAVKSFSTMSWEELLKGLTAVAIVLALVIGVTYAIGDKAAAMVAAGIGLAAMAVGMVILGAAVKIFASMSWGKMLQGLAGITIALLAIAAIMNLMPGPMVILTAAGLILVAVAIGMLAGSIAILGNMKTSTLAKGLLAIAGGLLIIGIALNAIPPYAPVIAAGIWLVALALIPMAQAIKMMGKMSWSQIAKGLVALGGSLLILGIGLTFMAQAIPGAIALTIATVALAGLVAVLKVLGKMNFGTILKSLAKLAIVLGGIALAALLLEPAIPAMIALGIALIALGVGFALAGAGAFLVAKAFKTFSEVGAAAAKGLKTFLQALGEAIPALSTGLAKGIVEFIRVFTDAAPIIAEGVVKLLNIVVDALIQLMPKAMEFMNLLIDNLILLIYTKSPQMIDAGFFLIEQFLTGLRNNIGHIVDLVADIVVKFLQKFQDESPRVIRELAKTIETWFLEVARAEGEVAATILIGVGIAFIEGFWHGMKQQLDGPVLGWVSGIPGYILRAIGDVGGFLVGTGTSIINGLLRGLQGAFGDVLWFAGNILESIWSQIRNPIDMLYNVGRKVIDGLWNGMKDVWHEVSGWLSSLNPAGLFNDINLPKGHAAKNMVPTGIAVMGGLQYGMQEGWNEIIEWVKTLDPSEYMDISFNNSLRGLVSNIEDISPTIAPVLDLTNVQKGADQMREMISINEKAALMTAASSFNQAQIISRTQAEQAVLTEPSTGGGDVNFEQNIYAPTQLSTSDIYRQTRNQIRIAKEELSIP
jgi:hypothetical protein